MATLYSSSVTSTAYKITRTVTGLECDVCHKVIPVDRKYGSQRYFEITTGHSDWGNDSVDSYETLDVCEDCAPKYIAEYLRDCSDTAHLRVESEVLWGKKVSEVVDTPPKEGEITRVEHDWY